jgi:hypothetical protein
VGAGFWNLTDREAASFRAYLLKGGFAIFEDFDGAAQWANFEAQMRRVLPDGRFVRLDRTHRIFGSFFEIKDIDAIVHPMSADRAELLRDLRGQRPAKRLMVIANFDNDVPEVLGVVRAGTVPLRRLERGLQAGRQLPDLRDDSLTLARQLFSVSHTSNRSPKPLGVGASGLETRGRVRAGG